MLTQLTIGLPTDLPPILDAPRKTVFADRVAQLEQQVSALVDQNRNLIQAIQGAFDTLNRDGALDVRNAALEATIGLKFPASQGAASSNVNTLDDYSEGTWTPALTFATPGNLVVAYTLQQGAYVRIGRTVTASFLIVTSTFTHTTSTGNALIGGLPFTPSADAQYAGALLWSGITKAGYTSFICRAVNGSGTSMDLVGSGSGATFTSAVAADLPSGTQQVYVGTITYLV